MTRVTALPSECTIKSARRAGRGLEYRNIVGYPGYRVGSDGSVWSCWRRLVLGAVWRQLKASPHRRHGYQRVTLTRGSGLKRVERKVHVLVLEAFVGPRPRALESCHRDGNKLNCRVDNLRWDTHKANLADRKLVGTDPATHHGWRSLLTTEKVQQIREIYGKPTGAGIRVPGRPSIEQLARQLGVTPAAVSNVIYGKTWKKADG